MGGNSIDYILSNMIKKSTAWKECSSFLKVLSPTDSHRSTSHYKKTSRCASSEKSTLTHIHPWVVSQFVQLFLIRHFQRGRCVVLTVLYVNKIHLEVFRTPYDSRKNDGLPRKGSPQHNTGICIVKNTWKIRQSNVFETTRNKLFSDQLKPVPKSVYRR